MAQNRPILMIIKNESNRLLIVHCSLTHSKWVCEAMLSMLPNTTKFDLKYDEIACIATVHAHCLCSVALYTQRTHARINRTAAQIKLLITHMIYKPWQCLGYLHCDEKFNSLEWHVYWPNLNRLIACASCIHCPRQSSTKCIVQMRRLFALRRYYYYSCRTNKIV